jgi:hypothetical protein
MNVLKGALCLQWVRVIPLFFLAMASAGESPVDPDFAVGQEWSLKSSTLSTAKIVIGRIEPWKNKIAIHVSIIDIAMSSSEAGLRLTTIAHIPFEKSALAASVDKLLLTGVVPPPKFETGYRQWKEQNGGIFTISVAQAIGIGHSGNQLEQ